MKNKILSVKPGITGYWVVNGRNNISYQERVIMEATYVDNISIKKDIEILLKTVELVIKLLLE